MRNREKNTVISNARVIATLLVLLGHCVYPYSTMGAGWGFRCEVQPWFDFIAKYIYSFHMPFFMVISGFTFSSAYSEQAESINYSEFIIKRVKRLLIPLLFVKFFLWNPVCIWIGRFPLRSMNTLVELGHLWYLLVLFVFNMVAFTCAKLEKKYFHTMQVQWINTCIFGALIVLSVASPYLPNFGKSFITAIYYYPTFFFIGMLISKHDIVEAMNKNRNRTILLAGGGYANFSFPMGQV